MAEVIPEPIPFQDALQARAVRSIVPSEMRSDLWAKVDPALRERSMFSAGIASAEQLQKIDDQIGDIVAGQTTESAARSKLKFLQDSLTPEELRSDGRLNLILSTNVDMARGYGSFAATQQPEILDQWPAQELVRGEERKEPRDWPARWAAAGGKFYPGESDYPEGRMIAPKNDPIWESISAFGLPYPPFDFNSGMDLQDVDRDEAEQLGVIEPDDEIEPQDRGFNDDLEASPSLRDDALGAMLSVVLRGIALRGADGVFRLLGGAR